MVSSSRTSGGVCYGPVHHCSAATTAAIRRGIQHDQDSLRQSAARYSIIPKTFAKRKKRTSTEDCKIGPSEPKSKVLSSEDEAIVVAFRRHTLLSLEECVYPLQAPIPQLTRSSLHRCLQRHGIARLPNTDDEQPKRSRFKRYLTGYLHIDIAEVRTQEGKLYRCVAIDWTSKFPFVELHEKANRRVAGEFLEKSCQFCYLKDPDCAHQPWHTLRRSDRRWLDARRHQSYAG